VLPLRSCGGGVPGLAHVRCSGSMATFPMPAPLLGPGVIRPQSRTPSARSGSLHCWEIVARRREGIMVAS
jgi:hypothetical protein